MTNAEKYLRDEVSAEKFARAILEETPFDPTQEDIIAFLNKPCKPQLTEDERVILRNLKTDKYILRDKEGNIILCEKEVTKEEIEKGLYIGYILDIFNHLFQFIKNGEEYEIKELLKGE